MEILYDLHTCSYPGLLIQLFFFFSIFLFSNKIFKTNVKLLTSDAKFIDNQGCEIIMCPGLIGLGITKRLKRFARQEAPTQKYPRYSLC